MTIPSATNRSGPYSGNGVTTVFDYEFRIVDENHIKVISADANGVETVLTIDADYIVSDVSNPAGGQVGLTVPLAVGKTLTLLRNVPFTQETDLENQGAYYADTVEASLDLAAMRDQQLQEQLDRAVQIPASEDPAQLDGLVHDILRLADSADNIDTVATNIGAVNNASANMAAIIAAPAQAAAAAASATAAAGSAAAAATSETNAANSATAAAASAAIVQPSVATRAALKALDTANIKAAYLTEAGREGAFVWKVGDYSAQIAADTQEGIYIKANAVASAAGAWVRVFARLSAEYFGASASAGRAANVTALQAAVNVAQLYAGELFLPATYLTNAAITVSNNLRLYGVSAFTSGISTDTGAAINLVPDTGVANNNTWYGFLNFSAVTSDAGHFGIEYASSGSEYLSNWIMEGVYSSGPAGSALFDSTGSTVGIFSCTLRRNWFANGLTIKDGGDSITIIENTINGNGIGVFVNSLKVGARQLVIRNNNITTRSECIYLLNVTGTIVDSNWMETPSYLGNYTGTTGALLYAQASPNTRITRNTIQPLSSVGGGFVPANYSIRLNTSGSASSIVDNDIAIGAVGHIQIGAGVANTLIHWDNKFDVTAVITDAGTGTWGTGNTPGVFNQVVKFTTTAQFTSVDIAESTNAGTGNGPYREIYRNKAGGAAVNDGIGGVLWYMNNSVGVKTNLGYITMTVTDPASGTEDGQFNIARMVNGSLVVGLTIGATFAFSTGGTVTGNFMPAANASYSLGTTSLRWTGVFLDNGATLNFNNGNYVVTHAAGQLTFSGKVLATDSIGYAAGAGGTVVQATSKATGVTLSKATGKITTAADALAANTAVSFTLTNTAIAATDTLIVNHAGGGTFGAYVFNARCAAGSATISIRNLTAGSLSEALDIRFAILRSSDT